MPDGFDAADVAWLRSFTPAEGGHRLPDGAIVQGVIAVVSFIAMSGEQQWMLWHNADLPISSSVGLLELAKLKLIDEAFDQDDVDDGEVG